MASCGSDSQYALSGAAYSLFENQGSIKLNLLGLLKEKRHRPDFFTSYRQPVRKSKSQSQREVSQDPEESDTLVEELKAANVEMQAAKSFHTYNIT
ncbi:hypothetical protein DPEC_G00073180 [Dallia pectoralis]|uniref:Uncharacterized protein n=1 Tax=Dallia pectoralis TaxID=75939 RepID=A0ACC2H306_DALPE|nr:hypothetical protein DPEC_G00073180 [Dallia pectoralis]